MNKRPKRILRPCLTFTHFAEERKHRVTEPGSYFKNCRGSKQPPAASKP